MSVAVPAHEMAAYLHFMHVDILHKELSGQFLHCTHFRLQCTDVWYAFTVKNTQHLVERYGVPRDQPFHWCMCGVEGLLYPGQRDDTIDISSCTGIMGTLFYRCYVVAKDIRAS